MAEEYKPERYNPKFQKERSGRGKKNRKKWCGGHAGRAHIPEWIKWTNYDCSRLQDDHIPSGLNCCWHRSVCKVCGKVLSYGELKTCPEYGQHNLMVLGNIPESA